MKVLLIDPPHRIFPGLRMWTPSFGLLQLAAYLEREGIEVQVLDGTALKNAWKGLAKTVSTSKADVIGVTCSATCLSPEALQTISLCRTLSPEAKIIAGGGHFTLMAEPILKEIKELDYIVLGEGEIAFFKLLQNLSGGGNGNGLKGIAFLEDGKVISQGRYPPIPNLDSIPGVWRGRSGRKVVEEISFLHRHYGKSLFVFNENTFNWNRRRVEEFLEELGRSGLRIHFWFQSRIKDILRDEDLVPEMRRLGLYEVMLGIESIHPDVLNRYDKQQSREMAQRAIDILRRNKIMVMANIMFGDWNDSEESLKEVFQFVKPQSDFLILTLTTPLPGTRYFEEAERLGRIRERDFGKYDFMHPIMDTQFLSAEKVHRLQQAYLKRYYTQPRILLGAFFNSNPFKRMAYRLILRYVWENATRRPWRQPNLEENA